MGGKPHRISLTIPAALVALLAMACWPAATPVPMASAPPTSTRIPAKTRTPTQTPSPPTLTPTSQPIRTPRPTRTATPTATPTPTPTPLPEVFRPVIPADEVFGGIERLRGAPGGGLWAITEGGIARLVDTSWSLYLSDYTGELAGIDASGRIWVTSEDASEISAWDGDSWTTYGADAGWTPLAESWYTYVSGGQSDALGRLWFATSQDVRVFDGERWVVFSPADMGMGPPVHEELDIVFGVAILDSGGVWVRECEWGGPGPFGGRGVRWFDGSTADIPSALTAGGSWHGADSPVASGCATAITEDDAGHVWAGVEENLWRYDPTSGAWTEFSPPESPVEMMRFGFIEHLEIDQSGDPWPMIVLCGGASCYGSIALYRVHNAVWTPIGEVAEFEGAEWGPIFDADGRAWVFWSGGVYRIVDDTPELMASLYARSVVTDGSGQVWFLAWYEGQEWLWTLDINTE